MKYKLAKHYANIGLTVEMDKAPTRSIRLSPNAVEPLDGLLVLLPGYPDDGSRYLVADIDKVGTIMLADQDDADGDIVVSQALCDKM